jgi:hypothetical protein
MAIAAEKELTKGGLFFWFRPSFVGFVHLSNVTLIPSCFDWICSLIRRHPVYNQQEHGIFDTAKIALPQRERNPHND